MSWHLDAQAPLGTGSVVRRHRLHNGLCLVSVIDRSAPVVAYQSWFAVGSRHEKDGHTGLCHLFEHLMFNETQALALGEFDRQIEGIGGDTNAATWVDWTFYTTSVPAAALPLIVKLEATRMTQLVLSEENIKTEREIVMSERIQCIHDDIDGFAGQELFRHAFTTHGYGWPTIGWMEDIRSLSIADMEEFYCNYYAPNNLTLVVVGDFEESALLAAVETHYGALASSGMSPPKSVPEPEQNQERVHRYAVAVTSQRLLIGYKAPPESHCDWPAISFACQLLAGSASSPLHRELVVQRELLTTISCEVMPFHDASLIEVSAIATRQASLDEILLLLDAKIVELASALQPASEIRKVASQLETEFWSSLTTAEGKAESLGHYQCVHGDFRKLLKMAIALSQVSAEEVQRVLLRYFTRDSRTVIRIEPEQ